MSFLKIFAFAVAAANANPNASTTVVDVQGIIDSVNQLQDFLSIFSYVVLYALGFLAAVYLVSNLPS